MLMQNKIIKPIFLKGISVFWLYTEFLSRKKYNAAANFRCLPLQVRHIKFLNSTLKKRFYRTDVILNMRCAVSKQKSHTIFGRMAFLPV